MHTEVTCGRIGGEEVGGAGLVSLLVHLRPVSELGVGLGFGFGFGFGLGLGFGFGLGLG